MSKKLVILDLDGTLLNTIGDLAASCNYILEMRGLPTHGYDDYRSFIGNGVTRLIERALPEQMRTPEYIEDARKEFVSYYTEHIDDYSMPYMGVIELLTELTGAGAALAIASNKFHDGTVKLVEKFFGQFTFVAIHGNREGFPLKPDKAIVDLIMEQAGATAEDTYMVGDSGVDIKTALAAGVHSIGVSWGFRPRQELEQSGAEVVVDSPKEIFEVIFK